MNISGKTILFFGDSITEGSGASCNEKIFHQVLKKEYNLKDALNYGIGGTRIARQKTASEQPKYDKDFCMRVSELPENVDMVVVFGGTNDFGHGDAEFGQPCDRTPDTFCGACHYLMEKLIKKYPDKPIIFMTPLHRADEITLFEQRDKHSLKDYVHTIKETAEFYSIPLLDLYSMAGMQAMIAEQNELYYADGLHPNDRGYAKIAYILGRYIQNM